MYRLYSLMLKVPLLNYFLRKVVSALKSLKSKVTKYIKALAFRVIEHENLNSSFQDELALGRKLFDSGDLVNALRAFKQASLVRPNSLSVWQGIADVALKTGQVNLLIESISEAANEWQAKHSPKQSGDKDDRYRRRRGLPIGDIVLSEYLTDEKFVVLDGGAREAEADERWSRLEPMRLSIHGFEPEGAECTRLNALSKEKGLENFYYPIGLWSIDGILPFHENHAGGGSSFMQQNQKVTDRWKFENPTQTVLAREIFRPKCTYDVKVATIDTWARENEIHAVDFMKLNVQGGELAILQTTGPLLKSVLGLLVEVSFCESYVNRPFFSDIDVFLRSNGFVFFDLLAHHYIGRDKSPIAQQHLKSVRPKLGQLVSNWGQLIEGHALYLRDPITDCPDGPKDELAARQALKLACIAEIYGQIEFAFELVHWAGLKPSIANTAEILDHATEKYTCFY